MQIWAAIDILEGSVVTLVQGRPSERTVWKEDPLQLAKRWQREGADGLHIIDLDAALQSGSNMEMVLRIIGGSDVPVQVGGGVRDRRTAGAWLDAGAERIVVGTMAYVDTPALAGLLRDYGSERIVVAADYKDGKIMTRGWTESREIPLIDAVRQLEGSGVANVLTTSVGRDGTGSGPDLEGIGKVRGATKMKVLASGGIRNLRDVEDLDEAGADGVVLGRALYEGTIKISDARGRR